MRGRAAALQNTHRPRIVPAHPDARSDAAGKAQEPAILVAACGAGLARNRSADLRGLASTGADRSLHQVGHPGRHPGRHQHAAGIVLMLVEQPPVRRRHLRDAIGRHRHPLARDGGEGARHVDQAHV